MALVTGILLSIRSLMKAYEKYLEEIQKEYQMTSMEIRIISFLHNNPGKDTIGDISEIRMLPKGNVSQSVEALVQKSMIRRAPDKKDRRKVHLFLTEKTEPIAAWIERVNKEFREMAFAGLTKEEMEIYTRIHCKIGENAREWLEERK